MKYVLSAVLGALAFFVALLFGKRGLSDNGARADRVGNDLDRIASTASSVASGVDIATSRVESVADSVGQASDGIDRALGILARVRQRTEADQNGDWTGTGGD